MAVRLAASEPEMRLGACRRARPSRLRRASRQGRDAGDGDDGDTLVFDKPRMHARQRSSSDGADNGCDIAGSWRRTARALDSRVPSLVHESGDDIGTL